MYKLYLYYTLVISIYKLFSLIFLSFSCLSFCKRFFLNSLFHFINLSYSAGFVSLSISMHNTINSCKNSHTDFSLLLGIIMIYKVSYKATNCLSFNSSIIHCNSFITCRFPFTSSICTTQKSAISWYVIYAKVVCFSVVRIAFS